MTCPRCSRRTVTSHGEPWCVVCGTVQEPPSEKVLAEIEKDLEKRHYPPKRKHTQTPARIAADIALAVADEAYAALERSRAR